MINTLPLTVISMQRTKLQLLNVAENTAVSFCVEHNAIEVLILLVSHGFDREPLSILMDRHIIINGWTHLNDY